MMTYPKLVQLTKILLTTMSLSLTCLIIMPPQSTSIVLAQQALLEAQHSPSQIQMVASSTSGNNIVLANESMIYLENNIAQEEAELY